MIALVDYGVGNLRSVHKALAAVGAEARLTDSAEEILAAEKVVLPGVGAFGDGMHGMRARGLEGALMEIVARGTALLGICLGMQLLFESSAERGEHRGLGCLPGQVLPFQAPGLKIPHTGWNEIKIEKEHPLLSGLPPGSYAYFNHGYYCAPHYAGDVLASSVHGQRFAAIVGRGRLYGVQFHPEKSQAVGLQILRNFVERG